MKFFLNKYYPFIVCGLLIIFFIVEIGSSSQESQTTDEGVHLAAGYSYLMTGDFRMNTEHPPLLKELAAFPLVLINRQLVQPFSSTAWKDYDQWQFAQEFIYHNNVSADTILFLGRLPTMLLSVLLGLFVFLWSKKLFGIGAGLFSLAMYVFCPNIIAHSRYITTDLGLTLFFFLTIYYFGKYLKTPNNKFLVLSAIFFSLAQVSKYSAIILVPILITIYLIICLKNKNSPLLVKFWKKVLFSLLVFISIFFITTFIVYGFELKKPIEDKNVQEQYNNLDYIIQSNTISEQNSLIQKIITITVPRTQSGKVIKSVANNINWPAFSYLNGLTKLFFHNYYGHTSYLLGQYSEYGWWYYFPLAFLVKSSLPTLICLLTLILVVIISVIKNVFLYKNIKVLFQKISNSYYILVIPSLIYLAWSLTSNLNIGVRHVLLIYPFLFVLGGRLLIFKQRKIKMLFSILVICMLGWQIYTSINIYPHYLAYFNEIAGGPKNGSIYLVDSNIDWGQDVKKLKKYMDDNHIGHVCLSYFGQAKLEYYGIDYWYLPDSEHFQTTQKLDCVVAISLTSLYSEDKKYSWLLDYTPNEKIGYSIYIYDFRKN